MTEWIGIHERMPDTDGIYWVANIELETETMATFWKDKCIFQHSKRYNEGADFPLHVTHWMEAQTIGAYKYEIETPTKMRFRRYEDE